MPYSKKVHCPARPCSSVWRKTGLKTGFYFIAVFFLLSTICVASGAAQSVDRAKLLDEIIALQEQIKNTSDPAQKAALQEELERKEALYLAPAPEDLASHAEFLRQAETGVIRLLPRESFDLNNQKLSLRGGGCFFSFSRMTHEYGYGSDLSLERGNLFVGFAGTHFGFLVSLGDAALEKLTVDHPGLRYLATFVAPTNEPGAREQYQRAGQGFTENGFFYISRIAATVGITYVVRSVYQERSDVLIAFRVLRQDTDGSLILLWKRLKWFATPQLRTDAFIATVSAASYGRTLAPGAIAAVFGNGFSSATEAAQRTPLPTSLADVSITVFDKDRGRFAPLFLVTPNQINFQIPAETLPGPIIISIYNYQTKQSFDETMHVTAAAPAIFTANSNGSGPPSGYVLRANSSGQQLIEPIARYDESQKKFVPAPIVLGGTRDFVFLIVFGSGVRGRSSLDNVKVTIDGVEADVSYAGPTSEFVGLEQLNILIPSILAGRGEVEVVVTVDGRVANTFIINIQ